MKQPAPTQAVQPIGYEGKSRNVLSGFNAWGNMLPFINFFMFLFGLFTVPVEVLMRKNFGQRWFTVINFYAGLTVLLAFTAIQSIGSFFGYSSHSYSNNRSYYNNHSYYNQQQPVDQGPSFLDSLLDKSMFIILLAYIFISSYHFFKIWWRDRTNTAIHSFGDGTSRFEHVAVYLMRLINLIAAPIIRFYMLFLPKEERQQQFEVPFLMVNVIAFTNTVFEPLVLLILAFVFRGVTGTWFLISAAALAIYANWKEAAKLDRALDFRDSVIEADLMMDKRDKLQEQPTTPSLENLIMQQVAQTVENKPEVAEQVKQQYPDLMSIIDEMNGEKEPTFL